MLKTKNCHVTFCESHKGWNKLWMRRVASPINKAEDRNMTLLLCTVRRPRNCTLPSAVLSTRKWRTCRGWLPAAHKQAFIIVAKMAK